jgi:hypothetical protein
MDPSRSSSGPQLPKVAVGVRLALSPQEVRHGEIPAADAVPHSCAALPPGRSLLILYVVFKSIYAHRARANRRLRYQVGVY